MVNATVVGRVNTQNRAQVGEAQRAMPSITAPMRQFPRRMSSVAVARSGVMPPPSGVASVRVMVVVEVFLASLAISLTFP